MRFGTKLFPLARFLSYFVLVMGCSPTELPADTSQSTPTSSQGSSEHSSKKIGLKPTVKPFSKSTYGIGDVISIQDKSLNLQFRVHGTREHEGQGVIKPNRGQKWIVVDTTIANKGQEPKTFSVVSFELVDSKNNPYEVALLAGALEDVESPTGKINPGEERRGEVAFEVPEDATNNLKLLFKPNSSDCEAAKVEPKVSKTLDCEPIVVNL